MRKPDRTICLTCCEANSPTLAKCFLCGAVLNHEVKGIPAYYDDMRQRLAMPQPGDVILLSPLVSEQAKPDQRYKRKH